MRKGYLISALVLALTMLVSTATAAPVMVTIRGEVEFNQINSPPLGDANSGDPVVITFAVDSETFEDNEYFPTRGYVIDPWSFSMTLGSVEVGLQDPFPMDETPFFVIRDNDPAVDGFFIANNTNHPFGNGLPLSQTGIIEQFRASFRVTYEGDTLPSLDIFDALGFYDFTGLTVFGFSIDDGPFEAAFMIFTDMTIEAVPVDDDGDGILNEDDLCADTMAPELVPTVRLGTNRWALTDDDGVFDTKPPNGNGNGPGFMFDLADTGGCSCGQIIEMQGLGNGHVKFGCSNSAMLDWVQYVAGSNYGSFPDQGQPVASDIETGGQAGGGLMHVQQSDRTIGKETNRPDRTSRTRGDRLSGSR